MSFFTDISCLLISNVLGKSKAELFSKKLKEFGGRGSIFSAKSKLTDLSNYSHVIVDPSLTHTQLVKILGSALLSTSNEVVTSKWLTKCLESQSLVDSNSYILHQPGSVMEPAPPPQVELPEEGPSPSKQRKIIITSADDNESPNFDLQELPAEDHVDTKSVDRSKFICMASSTSGVEKTTPLQKNINNHIIDKLQEIVEAYRSTKDKWRVFGYEKAIIALKSATEPVDTYEKAIALPHVGKSIAEKITEIAVSGSFQKLEQLQSNDSLKSIQLFMRIWGVGAETANKWANQGLHSLDDVRAKVPLTANQKIGMKYFDDFDERMQREEVSRIEKVVEEAVRELDPKLMMVTCGSYRRGKPTCGDVDILITHPDGVSHSGIFQKLLNKLHEQEFLTDDLTIATHMKGGMMKYLGVCRLDEPQAKHRRIDIIVTPYNQYGCCLVYFTGSAHFNRSIRLMADKMGLSLTEHALYKDVIRGPNKEIIHHGIVVPTPTEESVFKYLGVPYRPPHERDHE